MNSASALPEKVCTTCGGKFAADALFCPNDGTPLSSALAADARGTRDAPDPYVGREISGHIDIRQLAGVGAMGRVYRAFQKGIDRDVAVKILHRELSANQQLVTRFHREAKVASRLQHPNVVQVHLAGQLPDGAMYIVMEYLDGLSLQSALAAAGGAMPLPRALHVALQICDAAGEAHAQGVVHRDLKPENVMLVRRGEDSDFVKVLDFGIARMSWGEQSMATAAGLIFGTARYISPEGAQGEQVGPTGDVYAVATLLYQMLSGRTPFEGEQAVGLLIQQIHDPPPPLASLPGAAHVPEPIAAVVMQNLAKDPKARCADARAFGRALVEAARGSGLSPEDFAMRPGLLSGRASDRGWMAYETPAPGIASPRAAPSAPSVTGEPRTTARTPNDAPPPAPGAPTTKWAPPAGFAAKLAAPPVAAAAVTAAFPGAAPHANAGSTGSAGPARRPSGVEVTLDDAAALVAAPAFPAFPAAPGATPGRSLAGDTAPGEISASRAIAPAHAPPPADVDASAEDDALASASPSPRREKSRAFGIVVVCFFLGAIVAAVAWHFGIVGPNRDAAKTLDSYVERATEALRLGRWDNPPSGNVRDLTNEGLQHFPRDSRLLDVRARATDELVKRALDRKFAADGVEALRLARLAHEFDPSDATAARLVEEYEKELHAPAPPGSSGLVVPAASSSARPSAAGAPPPANGAGATNAGAARATIETSPLRPRVGQTVELAVRVTSAAGGVPRAIDDPHFVLIGPRGGSGVRLPVTADGRGSFRASFAFPEVGKYDLAFEAKADGAVVRAVRPIFTEEARGGAGPIGPPAPHDDPAPPAPSAKWL